ncbi:MAG: PA4642 family protein [Pseudomonadales bacterium]|nr:PA4642 family protein [Pseudomonadales bacterium]
MATKPRPDKKKVIGEEFTDEMLVSYLEWEPSEGEFKSFQVLLKAYRGMTATAFRRFLVFFKEAGYDINVKNKEGVSFLETIRPNVRFSEYVDIMVEAGAE